jgi:hypothetical protein
LAILSVENGSVDLLVGILQSVLRPRASIATQGNEHACERIIGVVLVIISIFSLSSVALAQATAPGEYELKAAFLFNFAKFIDWPKGSFASPQSPFTICILGVDPFGHALDDNLQGKMIGDQPFAVRRLKDEAEARRCQILFVSSSETGHLADIVDHLRGANLLLVGDTTGFASSGGTIEFTLDEENRVRFTINTDAADRAGLKFSAKLLALAKIVHDARYSKGG